MKKFSKIIFLFGIIVFTILGCEEEKSDPINNDEPINVEDSILSAEGYIIGYDPCTINGHFRIGYVIISTDLKDTLITYNISDSIYTMPASILFNSDTLYKIPSSYFQNYVCTAYFPDSVSNEFYIKVTYTKSVGDEIVMNLCSHDINENDFYKNWCCNQVIIKSATKE